MMGMPGLQILKSFFEHAIAEGHRSTVLKSVGWLLIMLICATLFCFFFGLPGWVGTVFLISAICAVALYGFSYIYFMFKHCFYTWKHSFDLQSYYKKVILEFSEYRTMRMRRSVFKAISVEIGVSV